MIFDILKGFIFGITESPGAAGPGQLWLAGMMHGNVTQPEMTVYLYIYPGFILAVFFGLRHEMQMLISHSSSDIRGIFVNLFRVFAVSVRKKKGFVKIAESQYSGYSSGLIAFLMPSVILSCYFSERLYESGLTPWICGTGFMITSLFAAVVRFSDNGKKLPGSLKTWFAFLIGIVAGCSQLPGISAIMLVMAAFTAAGFERRFSYRFALISRAFTLIASVIFYSVRYGASFRPAGLICLFAAAIGTTIGMSLMNIFIKKDRCLTALTVFLFAEGLILGIFA